MEISPPQFANESPARPEAYVDDPGMVALPGAASAMCKPSRPDELVEAFDFTGSLTFPTETFIS